MRLDYFQLIDRIVDLDLASRTIKVEATVPASHTIFEGHFPGRPLMPGVLLIESMAQASGWLLLGLNRFERMPILAAVKEAKLRSFIQPGDRIDITARAEHEGSGFAIAQAKIAAGGKPACSATLTFTLIAFPNVEFRGHMDAMAERIQFPRQVISHD